MPAPVQITAEQIIREAKERELELIEPVFSILIITSTFYNSDYFILVRLLATKAEN